MTPPANMLANTLAALLMLAVIGHVYSQNVYELVHVAYQGVKGECLRPVQQHFVIKDNICSGLLDTSLPPICGTKRATSLEVTTSGLSGNYLIDFEEHLRTVTIRRHNCDGDLLVKVRVACAEHRGIPGYIIELPTA